MECTFVVGQKVVCIAEEWYSRQGYMAAPGDVPVRGRIYTVKEIVPAADGFIDLTLKECSDGRFDHKGFRPAQPHSTDLTVFEQMLLGERPVPSVAPRVAEVIT